MQYLVKKLRYKTADEKQTLLERKIDWSQAELGRMKQVNWEGYDYKPEANFCVLYDEEYLHCLLFTQGAYEKEPRAEVTDYLGPVHNDSCLEWFLSFDPDSLRYVNIETNALATKYLAVGESRSERFRPKENELMDFSIETLSPDDENLADWDIELDWGVYIKLPLALLKTFWKETSAETVVKFQSGMKCKANFYKCGDLTAKEHFLSWSPIHTMKPDFHRPEFFGDLILE